MTEIIKIGNDNGILDIKGDKYDSILLLDNEPIQLTFLREIGSTWRYQVAKPIDSNIIDDKRFINFVKYGFLNSDPLSKQFDYILKDLKTGEYKIEVTKLESDVDIIEIDETKSNYYSSDTYGGLVSVIETQSNFNQSIIDEYIEIIQNGNDPIVILLKTNKSENTFIIDGHHKLVAYNNVNKQPKCLLITRLDSPLIDKNEGIKVIDLADSKQKEYKNRFLEKRK